MKRAGTVVGFDSERVDDLSETNDPMKVAMRQIAGTFAQLEKARLVAPCGQAPRGPRAKESRWSRPICRPQNPTLSYGPKLSRSPIRCTPLVCRTGTSVRRWRRQPYVVLAIKKMLGPTAPETAAPKQ
jgi:hypothetical protein